jgi:hypothetical protein
MTTDHLTFYIGKKILTIILSKKLNHVKNVLF